MLTRWEQLRGHEDQRQLFQRSVARGRLSHSYVLAGPSGIGKHQFARLLAKSLFCRSGSAAELAVCGECRACRGFEAGSWPDYHEIGLLEGRSAILISQMAGEGETRGQEGLCYELSMTPQTSERRIAVVHDAGQMNQEASSALLKTLEEPPARSLILLITDHPDSLLPTIRSRAQFMRFFPLATSDIESLLLSAGLTEDAGEAAAVAALSDGSLKTAQRLLDSRLRTLRESIGEALNDPNAFDPVRISRLVTDHIEEMSGSVAEQRIHAQWLMKFIAETLRTRLRSLVHGDLSDRPSQRSGIRPGIDVLAPMLERTVRASELIERNAAVSLVIEALFDDFAKTVRTVARVSSH